MPHNPDTVLRWLPLVRASPPARLANGYIAFGAERRYTALASVTAAHTPWRMRTRLSTARSGYSATMNVALAPLEADIQYLSSRRVRVVLAAN